MKLRIFILLGITLIITSCGSKKPLVTKVPDKRVVIDEPIRSNKRKVHQLDVPKKNKKVTSKRITLTTKQYIEKFAPIAVREMHHYKIPASITLAQGILESGSGRSPLAIRSNNHFGIKCHKNWKGKRITHDDDEIGECFRKYKYPEESYEDHSKFLITRRRYSKLFKLRTTDYKGWAYGLKRAGYATDRKYPNKLIALIRKYDLDKYDRNKNTYVKSNTNTSISEGEKTRFFYKVLKGDTLYSIARKFNISVSKLKRLNNLASNAISINQELILR